VSWLRIQLAAIASLGWRPLAVLAGALLVLMAADFYFRVLVLRDSDSRSFTKPSAIKVVTPTPADAIFAKLESWVPKKVVRRRINLFYRLFLESVGMPKW
jgi:hypothetical protein